MPDPSSPATVQLPEVLPVFPLTGSLLLPGNWLPLNVFEPRYRAMIEDALGSERVIGMIQPVVPRQDNRPQPGAESEVPELYEVGCVGRIEECKPTVDGRYLVALVGVRRFRVRQEMPLSEHGYRRVQADYGEFVDDLRTVAGETADAELLVALEAFARSQQLEIDLERLRELPEPVLVNGLAMALPFAPAEKQALLEADPHHRRRIFLALLRMSGDELEGSQLTH